MIAFLVPLSVPPAGFERKGCTSALTLAATYVLTYKDALG